MEDLPHGWIETSVYYCTTTGVYQRSWPTLPSPWQAIPVEDGVYYWCPQTGATQWEWPTLPPGWEAIESEWGVYYYCAESDVAQWEWPSASQAHAASTIQRPSHLATAQTLALWVGT